MMSPKEREFQDMIVEWTKHWHPEATSRLTMADISALYQTWITMSDTMEVRDHSQPCEHGETEGHDTPTWEWCDGGKRIVLPRSVVALLESEGNERHKAQRIEDLNEVARMWGVEVSDDE